MLLTRHLTSSGPRWALGGRLLPEGVTLGSLLALRREDMVQMLHGMWSLQEAEGAVLSPVEDNQEVWACGVTYLRSRVEREAESTVADVYAKVYEAERPEIFFKSAGWRTIGHGGKIRVRGDSAWNVPEPELTLVVNWYLEIVGYTVGNDVSSRSIEGENPLYLPQAKCYDGSCAVGPGIVVATEEEMADLPISLSIGRNGVTAFAGEARTSQMKRTFRELVDYLGRETAFPVGVFVMTGTGIVPPPDFSLHPGDRVGITVGELTLENEVHDR